MNIADFIDKNAIEIPERKSIICSDSSGEYTTYTFKEFHLRCNQFANTLIDRGVQKSDKVLLFVKPSLDFSVLVFALFKIGAIPIFMDPGMGRKNLLHSIKQCRPDIMISEWQVSVIKFFYLNIFQSIKKTIIFGKVPFFKESSFKKQSKESSALFTNAHMDEKEMGAILFTSGGTGIPKGVVYTQEIFKQQTLMLKEMYYLTPQEVDLPGFPLFSLFTLAIGMSSCIPEMNPAKPAQVDPQKVVKNIIDNNVTFAAGSPAIWDVVAKYCIDKNMTLSKVKYLVMFGAPVSIELHEKLIKILPHGNTYTPYGATECLPITHISGREVLEKYKEGFLNGAGVCVGIPLKGVEVKIIKISDEFLTSFDKVEELEQDCIGEIIVSSPTATSGYYMMDEQTQKAKIYQGHKLWHRMGDVGYLDKEGSLWFCGRKAHRVELENKTLYSVPTESYFNQHSDVKRSALIRYKEKSAAIVIERHDKKTHFTSLEKEQFILELKKVAYHFSELDEIKEFFFSAGFPVDGRHNIKINREQLANEYGK